MYTFSMPDITATKKQCMSCTENKRPNSIYSCIWWVTTLHSHGNFSFQVTKVLSVTECFRFVELLSVFTAPFKISQWFLLQQSYYDLQHFQSAYLKTLVRLQIFRGLAICSSDGIRYFYLRVRGVPNIRRIRRK
jgi:urea transporter